MYYSVIKDKDLSSEDMVQEMNLLYDANKENLVSIACYTSNGNLVEAVPVAGEKEDVDVTAQEWVWERWKIFIFPHRMYRICLTMPIIDITG